MLYYCRNEYFLIFFMIDIVKKKTKSRKELVK